jgi:RNA polymerase sigma factor (sigma-70 family)
VDEEIARLPAPQRRVIVLVDLEGETQSEAARRLGWSEAAVRGRLARARAALKSKPFSAVDRTKRSTWVCSS